MEEVKSIHFVGVGGVGMGSLAIALAEKGYLVTGSDQKLYEPMLSELKKQKIEIIEGYHSETLSKVKPDTVVIGNVVRKENPEASAWIRSDTKFLSFPEAVRRFLIGEKDSIVCSGTHGKTTTTSWMAFLLSELGENPTYLIGGVPHDLPTGCKITEGDVFVGEGDEYDSAFFDKGPKFLHYQPNFLIISSIEFDHADIYEDLKAVKSSFEKLVSLLPGDGLLVARFEDPVVLELLSLSLCPVQTFGLTAGAMWRIGKIEEDALGFKFEVIYKGRSVGDFKTPLFGEHNLVNLLSGIVVAVNMGIPMDKIRPIVEKFKGVKRRQEILQEKPFLLIDDFAHHPSEVKATLSAVKRRYGGRKIIALFEPRSATARRNVHQEEYKNAFDSADEILIRTPYKSSELDESLKFSEETLALALKEKGKLASTFANTEELAKYLLSNVKSDEIVVVMSNGEFDKIQDRIRQPV